MSNKTNIEMATTRKKIIRRQILLFGLSLSAALPFLTSTAFASGDAYFVLSPSSGSYSVGSTITLTVSEVSQLSDEVEGVQANLSYNTTDLQFNSASESGSPFTYLGQSTGGSGLIQIGEAAGSTVSGQQLIATISFTVLAANTPNPTPVVITSGSDIQTSSLSSVWNGVDTSASYTLYNPSSGGGSSGSSSGSSGSGANTKSTASVSKTTTAAPTTPSTPTPTLTSTAPSSITAPVKSKTITNSLSIEITNAQGKPVPSVSVVLDNSQTVMTNSQGLAFFSNVKSGSHTINVHGRGIQPTSQTVTLANNQNKIVKLKVKDAANSLGLLEVILPLLAVVVIGGATILILKRRLSRRFGLTTATPASKVVVMADQPSAAPQPIIQNIGPLSAMPPAPVPPSGGPSGPMQPPVSVQPEPPTTPTSGSSPHIIYPTQPPRQ